MPAIFFWLFPFVLLMALPGKGFGQIVHLSPEETAWICSHPTIRMMASPEYQPADFFDEQGQHRGIAADILALISKRTGLHFEIVHLPQEKSILPSPAERGVDGVTLSAATPKRIEFWTFTKPYLEFPTYIITRQNVDRFQTADDLRCFRAAVVQSWAIEEYLRTNFPEIQIVPVSDTKSGLRKVSFGLVDAFVSDVPVSTYWLDEEGFANLKISGEAGFTYQMGISSRNDWPELHSILQKGLDSISSEERAAIKRKWLHLPYEPYYFSKKLWGPLFVIAGGMGISFLLALLWNRTLSDRVHKRTQELQQSEALYRTTLENISDAILLTDDAGTMIYICPVVEKIFNMTEADVRKAGTIGNLLGGELEDKFRQSGGLGIAECECTLLDPSGEVHRLLVDMIPVQIRNATRLYVCRDMTERLNLEARVRQQQKLETVGLLAGGVAHDFNNLIQVIQGFTYLAGSAGTSPEERQIYLREVTNATEQATRLTRQLLAFARQQPLEKAIRNINEIIADMLPLLKGAVGKAVPIDFQPSATQPLVFADRGQVEQILLNLCLNARDAMPRGGTISIRVSCEERKACSANSFPLRTGTFVVIRLTDTGDGMTESTLGRIFEPFFTTKPQEKGTGLGLAVVHGAVEMHKGFIEVQSLPGKGTTFAISLPFVYEAPTAEQPAANNEHDSPQG